MNFIKLYIGDYLRDTGTLTLAQHGAYALMLLEHYATEKPLPTGRELHRLLRADSKTERDAIDFVAGKYWHQVDGGLSNSRALHEIERASNQRAINQEIGKRGGRPKRTETQTESDTESVSETEANRNPNQTPDTKTKTKTPQPPEKSGGDDPAGFAEFWNSWPASARKQDRKKCAAKWRRGGYVQSLPLIVAHVEASKQSKQWRDGFEPAPLTYLNGERWGDGEMVESETAEVFL